MAAGLSARGHTSRSRDFRFFSLASVMSVRKNHAHARLALFCVCVIKEKREMRIQQQRQQLVISGCHLVIDKRDSQVEPI